mgnify:CR=1 FL=1
MTCYAEYLVDVIDSINFFESLAAVMSGTETEFDKEQVKWLNELLSKQESIKGVETTIRYDAKKDSYGLVYNFNSLLALVVFEYIQMKNNGVRLMKCQNPDCGRYFIAKRKTAMYCQNLFIGEPQIRILRNTDRMWMIFKKSIKKKRKL